MRLFQLTSAVAVLGIVGCMALAQTKAPTGEEFAAMAASSDMFEIQSSELAVQKSQNAGVKEFAQMMIKDHTVASEGLKAAAEEDGVAVPAMMMDKQAAQIQALNDAPAESFDASYIDAQVAAHQEALSLLTAYAEGGDSSALKAHASKTAPVVQTHLEHAKKLDQQM